MDLQVVDIESYSHFLKLTKRFDKAFDTKTYVIHTTLDEINKSFKKINVDDQLTKLVDKLFKNKNQVYSNESWLNDSHIGKLNAISQIIKDIRSGVGITSPISISYYQNYKTAIHPGSTRLLLSSIYFDIVSVVITDYSGIITKKFKHLDFKLPENTYIKNIETMRFSIDKSDLADAPRSHREVSPVTNIFKELTDHCEFYGKPTKASIPMLYQIKDDKLYVGENCIAVIYNNRWSLFL